MAITAAMVKDLREQTGAGMMDCKKALTETNGDMEAAVDFLREKGLATAQKKAGRIAGARGRKPEAHRRAECPEQRDGKRFGGGRSGEGRLRFAA